MLILSSACMPDAFAQNNSGFSFKGFGTISAVMTDTDEMSFRRALTQDSGATTDISFKPDSRLGLQLDYDFNEHFHFGVQVVAREQAGDSLDKYLDWAYVRWSPDADTDIRFGRLAFDTFALSDYRNVDYSYPWVRPPDSFYSAFPPFHFDGVDFRKRVPLSEGLLSFKLIAGNARLDLPNEGGEILGARFKVAGGSVSYTSDPWQLRLGYQIGVYSFEFPRTELVAALESPELNFIWPGASSLSSIFRENDSDSKYASANIAYDDGIYLGQLEVSHTAANTVFFPDLSSAYFSFGRRFNAWTWYGMLGASKTDDYQIDIPPVTIPVPEVVAFSTILDNNINKNGIDQRSVTAGLRWDFYKNTAINFQWDNYQFGEDGTKLWAERDFQNLPDSANVWTVSMSFIF